MELGKWKCGTVWVLAVIRVSLPKHSWINVSSEIFCQSEISGCVHSFLPHSRRGQARLEAVLSFFSSRRLKLGVLAGETQLILITTPTANSCCLLLTFQAIKSSLPAQGIGVVFKGRVIRVFFLATVDFKKWSLVTGKKLFTQVRRLFLWISLLFSICFPLKQMQIYMPWSQITKSLCDWKCSPYLKFSEIGWKVYSGSHKYVLVSDIGIQGMKSGQGHNTCEKGRGKRKGEQQWNGSSFSEAGNSGLYSWARDL